MSKVILAGVLIFLFSATVEAQPKELADRLDSLFRAAEKKGFHGNVLVSQHGKVALLQGYGFANHKANTRFSPSTLVQIGSNVKDFTKTAVFQLVEQGRLQLTDTLGRFVNGLPPVISAITVNQLLNHRSGLPLGLAGDEYPLRREEMIERLKNLKLAFAPGSKEQYSNLGYALLAFIIEKQSGMGYDAYVAKNILKPLGLRKTGTYIPKFNPKRIAHGYMGTEDRGTILDMPHDAQGHLWSLRGNGGYLSTLSDMHRFYQALSTPALLKNENHRREVFDPSGMSVLAGSDMICFFLFANYPGVGAEVFIASNHSTFTGNRLLREIEPILGVKVRGGGGGREIVTNDGPAGAENDDPAILAPMMDRLPDNGAGKTIRAYLDAFNTGDPAIMRQFFTEYAAADPQAPPIETRLQRYQQMRGNLGKLTFKGFRQAPEGEGLAVSVDTEAGEPATLTFLLEQEPSFKLKGIMVMVGN